MRWNWKRTEDESLTSYSLLLVAMPELEGTPIGEWLYEMLVLLVTPIRRAVEILLADTHDLIHGLFRGIR